MKIRTSEERRGSGRRQRLPGILAAIAYAVAALAVLAELSIVLLQGFPLLWVLPVIVSAVGVGFGIRLPWVSLILVSAAPLISAAVDAEPTSIWSITVFMAFFLAIRNRMGPAIALIAGGANLAALGLYYGTITFDDPVPMIGAAAALLAAATGSAVRNQDAYRLQLEARAREALAGRAAAVDRGVAEERLKIARDLHDSVGHHVAVVSMHVGAAEVVLRTDPARAEAQLALARSGMQSVLKETQEILRVLRFADDPDSAQPSAQHGAIGELVANSHHAGLRVDSEITGLDVPLEQPTSIALYRIVQELLTNAQRHGVGALTLRVAIDPDKAIVEASNMRARSKDSAGGGTGLIGMRERAESVGGTLESRQDGQLFTVKVMLPVKPAPRR